MKYHWNIPVLCMLLALQCSATALAEGTKTYRNEPMRVEFNYPANWTAAPCADIYKEKTDLLCVEFRDPSTILHMDKEDVDMLFTVKALDLDSALKSDVLFEKVGTTWVKHGRFDTVQAQTIHGNNWQGIYAVAACGISDDNGFHAVAGNCLTAVLSQKNYSVVFETTGLLPTEVVLDRVVRSFRFIGHNPAGHVTY